MSTRLDLDRTEPVPFPQYLTNRCIAIRGTLPAAANGKPPRSRNARAAYVHNEMGAGRMKPFHVIDGQFDAFLEDGGDGAEVLALFDVWRADFQRRMIERSDRKLEQCPPLQLLPRLSLAETLAECKANPVQERIVANPSDVAAWKAFRKLGGKHHAELGVLLHQLDRAIVSVENGNARPRVYGATRPMEMVR